MTLVLTLGVTILVILYAYKEGHLSWFTICCMVPCLGLGLFSSYDYLVTKHVSVPTPEFEAAQASAERKEEREQSEFEGTWYYRYPAAAFWLFVAYHVVVRWPSLWWVSILIVLVAAFQARELSLFLIGVGCMYLVVQGIAALPTSLAIIFGALIIATALGGARSD